MDFFGVFMTYRFNRPSFTHSEITHRGHKIRGTMYKRKSVYSRICQEGCRDIPYVHK